LRRPEYSTFTLRQTILACIGLIVLLTTVSILIFVDRETTRAIFKVEDEHTRNLLETVRLNIETEYQSLLYHREHALQQRQNELKNVVGFALTIVDGYYQDYRAGKLTEAQAKKLAMNELRRLRYEGGTGYFWIHELSKPTPNVLMHPTIPEIENTFPNDPLFYKALPSGQHVLLAMNDATKRTGSGYLRYTWPKPTAAGVNKGQPKLSYLARTKHWNWIIGSGVYIDDIEAETAKRKSAIVTELQQTLSRVKIADSGYLFLFDGQNNVIIHPSLANRNVRNLINPRTKKPLFNELMQASRTPDIPVEYTWDKPPRHKDEYRFTKRAYVTYFAPLDWYLGSSVYLDEVKKPAQNLTNKIIVLALVLYAFALALALILSRYLSKPLLKLANAAQMIEEQNFSGADIPISGTQETRRLGVILNRMTTSLIETNSALKINEEKQRTLFETANDAILLLRDGVFIDCNRRCCEMLGMNRDEIIGRTPKSISPEAQPDGNTSSAKVDYFIEQALTGQPQFFEWRYLRSDGSAFDSEISLNRVDLPDNPHLLAVMRDISERKRLERDNKNNELRLRQAQKMEAIGTLAGGIAHDFNNILTGIIGYGELAMDDIHNPEEARSHLHEMLTAADRARNLVRQILTFSRRVETEVSAVEPHLIVKEAMKLLRASIPSTVEIKMDIDERSGTVMADPSQLHQIIMNLCTNAYAAMKAGGTLSVAVKPAEIAGADQIRNLTPGNYVQVTVSDTGCGMDDETLSHIFEPFFTTKAKGEGTGLGLSTVHGIVKSLKGDISVYSELNRGTVFHVYLPRVDARANTEQVETAILPQGNGELILLVDDELPILGLGSHILAKLGYAVTATDKPEEAIAIFSQNPDSFSLVVTDYAMPHMTGAQLTDELLKIRPDIPIVLTSGFSPNVTEKWLKDAGITQFIIKPFNTKTFANVIGTILSTE